MVRLTLSAFVEEYVRLLAWARYGVLVAWMLACGGGAIFVMKFIQNTTQVFEPPSSTQAHGAQLALREAFPAASGVSYFNIFIESHAPTLRLTASPEAERFTSAIMESVITTFGAQNVELVTTYFYLMNLSMPIAASALVTPDGTGMVMPITLRANFVSKLASDWGQSIVDIVKANQGLLGDKPITALANGIPIFVKSILDTTEKDMGTTDGIVIPLAMLVMAMTVKSLRLMILPAASIGMTLAVSFAAMYFVSLSTQASSTTPSLMMTVCIAMSIDYNLFLLSRYKEELLKGYRGQDVVGTILRTAGHTILVSGFTLIVSLLGLIFFPMEMLQSFGYGCSISIACAMLVSLTFTPALLLAFPTFFEGSVRPVTCSCFPPWLVALLADDVEDPNAFYSFPDAGKAGGDAAAANEESSPRYSEKSSLLQTIDEADNIKPAAGSGKNVGGGGGQTCTTQQLQRATLLEHLTGTSSARSSTESALERRSTGTTLHEVHHARRVRSVFYRLRHILTFPWNLLVFLAILGGSAGIAASILNFTTTDGFFFYLPRGSDVAVGYQSFTASFGFGYTAPYHFLMAKRGDASADVPAVVSEAAFLFMQGYLRHIVADPSTFFSTPASTFHGIYVMGGEWTPYSAIAACLASPFNASVCNRDVVGYLDGMVNPTQTAAYTIGITGLDPTGNDGEPFYRRALALIATYQAEVLANATRDGDTALAAIATGYTIWIDGVGPSAMDAIKTIYDLFPTICLVTGAAVLLIVGIAFRSVMLPLRSLVSIAVTQGVVYGMVVLVFQSPGILNWTTWAAVSSGGAVSWTAPIVAFNVIVGVALDYDIFLITRIDEFVTIDGYTTQDAIIHGLCATGSIITAAGVIMTVAFFGLMLSSTPILNLLGFFIVTAVLFDTFVVRTLLVPTAMSLLGEANWWPRKLQQV